MGLFDLVTGLFSTDAADKAAKDMQQGYSTGLSQSNATLGGAQSNADSLYGKAYSPFTSLISSTGQGASAYGDATGANGADGLARAKALYQADPGYNGGLTTGVDQVMRTAAARGALGGGNTQTDLVKFASDYDNQKYQNYVNGLAPYLGANNSAVSGAANVLGSQAATDTGISGQEAQNQWNAATGSAKAQSDADMAQYQASQNFWGALLGGANMALKASGAGGYGSPGKAA